MKTAKYFIMVFVITYIVIGYLPAFRIKLHADTSLEYFIATIGKAIKFKTLVAFAIGAIVSFVLNIRNK